ncbi:DNA-directed RNA polymerase subunit beta [Pisciglobus halotolerans]|uniref:DNA-directed RNA polymerase subunit beta n=1 Tax=Pisciglobus halotolerans TaxID=745365 RepID=A0A1I3C5F6_9LACT|nr:DNA-directed RNA polymerase subunit beta [Pisciglobus halotolerans]SFH69556.1 DNA-directed RNA polymerase subunit beta [Pisciglobus halotolerans]
MTKQILLPMVSFLLKVLLVIVLIILAFIVGAMVGYGVLGDGHPTDVFKPEVWQHILSYLVKPTIMK